MPGNWHTVTSNPVPMMKTLRWSCSGHEYKVCPRESANTGPSSGAIITWKPGGSGSGIQASWSALSGACQYFRNSGLAVVADVLTVAESDPGWCWSQEASVSIASAVRWMDEYLRTGRTAPKPRGGDRRSGRVEAQAAFLTSAIEEAPDITLAELRERLIEERGETFAISTIHQFFRRHGISYKKRPRTPASRRAKT